MAEEESWEPIKPLGRMLSGRRIGPSWMHHTGHDANKGFGTKTREWEMDTVISAKKAAAYDRLAANVEQSNAPNGATVRKVSVDALRDELKSRGFLDTDAKGHVTAGSRTSFRRNKVELITSGKFMELDSSIWRV